MQSKTVKELLLRFLNSPLLWIAVASIPAVIMYGNRFLLPDNSTDVISYHLFNGERAIRNPLLPFRATEFYPVGVANLAPEYDGANYLARSLFGYRLGTILSLASAIGIVIVLYKLLVLILREQKRRFHAGWGLLLVNSAMLLEVYFQLATYFVDIMNAFWLLLALYLIVKMLVGLKPKQLPSFGKWVAALVALGLLIAFKLTNIPLILPLVGIMLWKLANKRKLLARKQLITYLACLPILILPLLPSMIANYHLTKNPVFPFYNSVFKSGYYPEIDFGDSNFGGQTLAQKVLWPVASSNHQIRLAEPHHIYNDYKLLLYWTAAVLILALLLIGLVKLGEVQLTLLIYFLASILLWGLLFGINRYILSTLSLGGLMLAVLIGAGTGRRKGLISKVPILLGVIIFGFCAVEDYRLTKFNLTYDMSWRAPLLDNRELHRTQLPYLFQKHLDLTPGETAQVSAADIMLNCHTNVSGLLSLLPGASQKPVVNIAADGLPSYAAMTGIPSYRSAVKSRLDMGSKTSYRWVSVFSDKNIGPTHQNCLNNIKARGGRVDSTEPISSLLGYADMSLFLASGTIPL